jgi:hypothetical protein
VLKISALVERVWVDAAWRELVGHAEPSIFAVLPFDGTALSLDPLAESV